MVAAQAVLGLVEPQSSGIGGGAFVVYYDARTNELTTFDAREKAPAAATEDRFARFTAEGGGGFLSAWQSGLSVGVPGIPRLLEELHFRYGNKPFRQLMQPARHLATDGFELTQRTSDQVTGLLERNDSCDDRLFFRDQAAFDYFVDVDGDTCSAKPAGTIMTNPDYADTLGTFGRGGDDFYNGDIAADIVAAVNSDANVAGDMTLADLANYEVIERAPVCLNYRGHDVCGMGPPSSGALAVGQILGIMENFDVGSADDDTFDLSDPIGIDTVHLFTQAGRLAFADRGQYVGDSDFVTVSIEGMLDKDYLASRSELIGQTDMGPAEAGVPPGIFDPTTPDPNAKNSGTSHISVVDWEGNALSMTTTVESSFGNGVLVRGFLLNNQLTDFAFDPGSADAPTANRVQANKRPRSSMSPTIVLDDGDVELVTGSPGGSRIIGYTAQTIMNHIDFGLDPQESINLPHFLNRNGTTDIEEAIPGITVDYDAVALQQALIERGHSGPDKPEVNIRALTSGLSIINVKRRKLIGGADKRRDGTVSGR